MGLGLLLMPALAGYFVQTRMYVFRYDTLRESGHHVFFRSALTGGILALIAHALVHALKAYYPTAIDLMVQVFDFEYSATAITSLLFGIGIVPIVNLISSQEKAAIKSAKKHGELMNAALAGVVGSDLIVEVLFENRQIYFGPIVEIGIGISRDIDFTIIPILKGFQNEDADKHVLSLNHKSIPREDESKLNILKTTVPISRVVSVRFFHEFPSEVLDALIVDDNGFNSETTDPAIH